MLSDIIWWTRKSRIQAAERLLANDFHTQLILVWYSLFSAGAAVYFLKFAPQSNLAQVSMVIYSVMILSMSLFMSGRNFKERGMLMKQGYEQLDFLYRKSLVEPNKTDQSIQNEISEEYQNIINSTENHKEIDHIVAIVKLQLSGAQIDKKPTKYHYIRGFSYFVFRLIYLGLFYLLPIFAVLVMKQI